MSFRCVVDKDCRPRGPCENARTATHLHQNSEFRVTVSWSYGQQAGPSKKALQGNARPFPNQSPQLAASSHLPVPLCTSPRTLQAMCQASFAMVCNTHDGLGTTHGGRNKNVTREGTWPNRMLYKTLTQQACNTATRPRSAAAPVPTLRAKPRNKGAACDGALQLS